MKHRYVYYVKYRLHSASEVKAVCVIASSKAEAYDLAFYEKVPEQEGIVPYSAWVTSVTYNNGNFRDFNTSEGNPY